MADCTIILNGETVTVPSGTTLSTLLPNHPKGCAVVLLKPATASQEKTSRIRLKTTAGDVVIEVFKGVSFPQISPENLRIHFEDKNAAAFGPFPSQFVPAMEEYRFPRGCVFLGSGGYDPGRSYLMFSKNEHKGDHGTAADGGVIGKVIFGLGIMNRWKHGDRVLSIEQVFSSVDADNAETVTNLSRKVEDGMQIFSSLTITAEGFSDDASAISTETAESVDHLLFVLKNGRYVVDRSSSTYIRDHAEGKLEVPQELQKPRREGVVTARTKGKSSGAIYIYTADVQSHPAHSKVGTVTSGIELARFAAPGNNLQITLNPPLIDLRGMLLKDAVAEAKSRGLKVMADNRDVESRVVIDQKPATTLEVLKEGKVSLYTKGLDEVIDITLDYENAPLSVDLFRRVTGLKRYPVGTLPFIYNVDEEMYLFKPVFPKGVNIIPENCPTKAAAIDAIALSNDSRPAQGIVGVRLAKNAEFGPTGEPFSGTNIIGRVIDKDKLAKMKEGSDIYIREVMK
ncbi:MAG TPA: methanogenesis marker 3 protein [Methanocorpusculum sp.]|nr:methanogenesis marker 3 protein [Methanocorpusculum sp.]